MINKAVAKYIMRDSKEPDPDEYLFNQHEYEQLQRVADSENVSVEDAAKMLVSDLLEKMLKRGDFVRGVK